MEFLLYVACMPYNSSVYNFIYFLSDPFHDIYILLFIPLSELKKLFSI